MMADGAGGSSIRSNRSGMNITLVDEVQIAFHRCADEVPELLSRWTYLVENERLSVTYKKGFYKDLAKLYYLSKKAFTTHDIDSNKDLEELLKLMNEHIEYVAMNDQLDQTVVKMGLYLFDRYGNHLKTANLIRYQ